MSSTRLFWALPRVLLLAFTGLLPQAALATEGGEISTHAAAIAEAAEHVKLESMREFDGYGGAYIEIDGVAVVDYYNCPWSRWFVVTTNADRAVIASEEYILPNPKINARLTRELIAQLDAVPDGGFVMVAVYDAVTHTDGFDGRSSISDQLQAALEGFGIGSDLRTVGEDIPYVALGRKGAAPGEALEKLGNGGQPRYLNNSEFDDRDVVRHPELPTQNAATARGDVVVTVIDGRTGDPLRGARVTVKETRAFHHLRTDRNGEIRFDLDGWSQKHVSVTARHPGLASMRVSWRNPTPGDPSLQSARLVMPEGVRIVGELLNTSGLPLGSQRTYFRFGPRSSKENGVPYLRVNDIFVYRPDPNGRFILEDAPADLLVGAEISFGHSNFTRPTTTVTVDEEGAEALRKGTARFQARFGAGDSR